MGAIGDIFTMVLLDPMINFLIILNNVLFDKYGLAIIAFTIVVRVITFPLTMRQLNQTRAMQTLQPQIQQLQKKFTAPKRRQQEIMKAYKEAGINPLGCLGPMVLQFPVLIALFYAIRQTLAVSPEALSNLYGHVYDWHFLEASVPLSTNFLGMNMAESSLIMVVLVGGTTWIQTRTSQTVVTDDRARAQQQMMQWLLPVMFMFFTFSFPSGVALYWVVTTIVSIAFNIITYGLPILGIKPMTGAPVAQSSSLTNNMGSSDEASTTSDRKPRQHSTEARKPRDAKNRSKRKNRRRRN